MSLCPVRGIKSKYYALISWSLWYWSWITWVQIPALLLFGSVILCKYHIPLLSQFPPLFNGDDDRNLLYQSTLIKPWCVTNNHKISVVYNKINIYLAHIYGWSDKAGLVAAHSECLCSTCVSLSFCDQQTYYSLHINRSTREQVQAFGHIIPANI